jgi:hypothetical protein
MTPGEPAFVPPSAGQRAARVLMLIGLATGIGGLWLNPDRMWAGWLMVGYYLVGIGLGGLFFVALEFASGASWSVAFRRVPEAMAATLPVTVFTIALVLAVRPSLYPWTLVAVGSEGGAFRQMWLTWPFFLGRSTVYLVVWVLFALAILRTSRRQDTRGGIGLRRSNVRLSVAFIAVFGLTFSLASFDWVMSREPHFYSTVFAVYNFAGLFLSGVAVVILLVVWLRATGPLRDIVRDEHLHDLGKLLFAFATFWMYIWFTQYMLIWYANIPEEAVYFVDRTRDGWQPLFLLNVALNWAVPFVVLMRRDTKRQGATLVGVALVVLVGRWVDLYLMILPPVLGSAPSAGVLELGLTAGGLGLFLSALFRALRQAPLVPIGDPLLTESLHYHQ